MRRVETDDWEVAGSHFAERFQLFTIIALGETIVLTGATTARLEIDTETMVAFTAAFLGTVCLWWLYFNYVSTVFERQLVEAEDRTTTGRDLYTFGHIPIIAGIILCAVGDEVVIAHPSHILDSAELLAVVLGPVLYLLAYVPIRLRMTGGVPVKRVVGAAVCVLIGALASMVDLAAVLVGGSLVAVLIGVVVVESLNPSRPPQSLPREVEQAR